MRITIEESYYSNGERRPDHDSAAVLNCDCGHVTEGWTHRTLGGSVAIDCSGCGETAVSRPKPAPIIWAI